MLAMRYILLPLLLLSFAASTSLAASTAGTDQSRSAEAAADRSPRQALDAWLESFNTHDEATRERWLLDNTTYSPEKAKHIAGVDQKIRGDYGPFELVRVVRTEGQTIEAEARHTGNGLLALIEITLDEEQPKRIGDVKLQPAEVKGNGDGPG